MGKKKKKIQVFCMSEEGGLAEYVFYQAEALTAKGHEVLFVCSPKYMNGRAGRFQTNKGLLAMPSSGLHPFVSRLFLAFTIVYNHLYLSSCIIRWKPDLVLMDSYREYLSPFWAWSLGLARKLTEVFMVANLHDPVRNFTVGPDWWHRWSVKSAYRHLNLVLVHSIPPAESSIPNNVEIVQVPHGVFRMKAASKTHDSIRAEWGVETDALVVLSFGFVRDNKNIDLLIRAVKELPNMHLVVAGRTQTSNDKPIAYYKELASQLGVADRCKFIERYIGEDEIPLFFEGANLVALTYSSSFYSQSGVLNLATAAMKPVIVSAADSPLLQTVEQFKLGIIIKPDDAAEIVKGIRVFQENGVHPDWDAYYRFAGWGTNVQIMMDHAFPGDQ